MDFPENISHQAEYAYTTDQHQVEVLGKDNETPILLDFDLMVQTGKVQRDLRRIAVLRKK